MDIVVILNGLGNQMSQYSFYLQKKKINKSTYILNFCKDHNGLELNKVFNIHIKQTILHKILFIPFRILLVKRVKFLKPLQLLVRLLNFKIINENFDYKFNANYLLPSKKITFYLGGWPSEKYFPDVKNKILSQFIFSKPTDRENTLHIKNINKTNSVSLHVRRGDYLDERNLNIFGKVCTKEYFEKAINIIEETVDDPHFFIFSNDFVWVKSNLQMSNVTYITCNHGENSWIDMYLMSICKHNIISNSTFSWWGAWLNANPNKKVISPGRYLNNDEYTDFYPESWIRLFNYE